VRQEKLFKIGSNLATRALLKANSLSVLLPHYRNTLLDKYAAQNVLLATHGTFASIPSPPDFTKRGNPDLRILAIGHWGTYKRLETLIRAFPTVLEKIPNARLIIAGANHHTKAGYWESIRDQHHAGLPIEFRGYVPEESIPELFQTASILVLPYDSATGSSGPAHQACEYGVPIVCSDIDDFREMAAAEGMSLRYYKNGDPAELAQQLIALLQSAELQLQMAQQNYAAGLQMTITCVVKNYLRWFQLQKCKRELENAGTLPERSHRWLRALRSGQVTPNWRLQVASSSQRMTETGGRHKIAPAGNHEHADNGSDAFAWNQAKANKHQFNDDGDQPSPIQDMSL
jgi:glycosyltransferase involved in cell wall biosynthesis